ncbi:MAG: hypothetical protein HWQ38_13440 [Nostoc sp. NMS7]|uniref:hypothetical protein n=1 Tax=Nostoc sp. NMS7 TaxID=2815391 RepID=UPI0025FE6604|nr:hypothetical protein [Nostoc sp. NMS7]MBN3947410.1 hypothetical protein [Nostoc sp. NMS7]
MTSSTIHADYSEDFDFEFDEQVFRPAARIGCSNYHRVEYGSQTLLTTYKTQQLFSEIIKSNTPSTPVPHRGGGRRYLIEPLKNIDLLV